MTRPTVVYFGAGSEREGLSPYKVYLRALLFATSKRGRVIEGIYVTLIHNEAQQNFNIWVYGNDNKFVRGSGLFIGETGIASSHHFMMSSEKNAFQFSEGLYRVEVHAHILGDRNNKLLYSETFELSTEHTLAIQNVEGGVYFDWEPDSSGYVPHYDMHRPKDSGVKYDR